ncbi:MAG: DMT family transporter [candidate division WOR-3 bacterium]
MFLLLLASIIWGTSFPLIGISLNYFSPLVLMFFRFFFAFLILFILFPNRFSLKKIFNKNLIFLSLLNSLGYLLQFYAQTLTTSSKTSIFINTSPIWTVLFLALFYKEKIKINQIISVIISMIGVFLIATNLNLNLIVSLNLGDILNLICAIIWSLFVIETTKHIKNYDLIFFNQSLHLIASILSLFFIPFEKIKFNFTKIHLIFYLSVFPTIISYFLYTKASENKKPIIISITFLVEILVSVILSVILLNEKLEFSQLLGMIFIFLAIILVNF